MVWIAFFASNYPRQEPAHLFPKQVCHRIMTKSKYSMIRSNILIYFILNYFHKQTKAQTKWITCYDIRRYKRCRYSKNLLLIDTPGLNTKSLEKEKHFLDQQFHALFNCMNEVKVENLHAICFVSHAHRKRLTSDQHTIFQLLSNFFGRAIESNVYIIATCADSTEPSVFEAFVSTFLRSPRESFKFNNSPFVYCDNNSQATRKRDQETDWVSGQREMKKFIDTLSALQPFNARISIEQAKRREEKRFILLGRERMVQSKCDEILNVFCDVYEPMKENTTDETYATVCDECQNNCCMPCRALGWTGLCAEITFFGGICKICNHSGKNHKRRQERYIQKPILRSDNTDGKVYDSLDSFWELNGSQICFLGGQLEELLLSITDLHNEVHEFSFDKDSNMQVDGMIVRFVIEEDNLESYGFQDRIKLLTQLRKEMKQPKQNRWKYLEDKFLFEFLPVLKAWT